MGTDSEDRAKAKDVRQGIVDQRPGGSKNKRPRPVILEHRSRPESPLAQFFPKDVQVWRKWKAYRSEAEAVRALEKLSQQYHLSEFRIREEQPHEPS